MAGEPVVDMQWGVYRKVYSGFIWGDRLNSVSMEAEAWFWRLHAVADDLGNLAANWPRLAIEAGGKRSLTPDRAEALTRELASAKLIRIYSVGSDNYVHIHGFEARQPANKNGRRIKRHPTPPDQARTDTDPVCLGNPTEPDSNCRESKSPNPIPNPNPNPTPTPGIQRATGSANRFLSSRTIASGNAPPGFVAFIDAYPTGHATDRNGLLATWHAVGLEEESAAIMAGLAAWKASERWRDGFVIDARKFLDTRRWEDKPPPPKAVDNFGRPVKPPPKPGPEKLPPAGQAEFKSWWRDRTPEQRAEFAKSMAVDVNTVDQNVNWQRVPATWARTGVSA